MRIIITGGLGFIGMNLAIHLRHFERDAKLIAIDWFDGASDAEKALFDEVHISCFADDRIMELYRGADVVVHLAAYTSVQESIADPLRSFDNNVVKSHKLLEFLRLNSLQTRVVFASTGGAIVGAYDGPVNEQIPASPLSAYGANKMAVEGLLSAYHGSYGLGSACLRFSNVYGPNSARMGGVISRFCQMYLQDGRLQINGDGKQTRDYIYVDDVTEAILRVIRQDAQGVFQLGTGVSTSILQVAKIFAALDPAQKVELDFVQALCGEVRHNKSDISHIRNELGFEPRFPVASGIQKTVEWFRGRALD